MGSGLTLPLYSYSYALFCTTPSVKCFVINYFLTLYTKPGVESYVPRPTADCAWTAPTSTGPVPTRESPLSKHFECGACLRSAKDGGGSELLTTHCSRLFPFH
jgi:hypothetical protein